MRKNAIIMTSIMLLSFIMIVPYSFSDPVTSDYQTFRFQFVEGWNLITLPLDVENNTISFLFKNISSLPYCFKWNATAQYYEVVDRLIPGYGYWIYVYENTSCTINGSAITEDLSIELIAPDNMIGWVNNYTITAEQIYKAIPGCKRVTIPSMEGNVSDIINLTYITYNSTTNENNFEINQGMGFWVTVNTSSVWNGLKDKVNPTVKFEKPIRALYIKNKIIRKLLFRMALIIGGITVEVNATDSGSGIAKVEFYVNGKLKGNDTTAPYTYNLTKDKLLRFVHMQIIKVVAYDNAGNSAVAKMIVKKYL